MRAPEFWAGSGLVPTLLEPLAALYTGLAAARQGLVRPWRPPLPVLCIGNLVAGGAGKTPVALSLAERLAAMGRRPHILTRGYGGRQHGPLAVDPARHDAALVGDEPLLLARVAPCWVAADRIAGARAAIAAGADLLVMDDGLQNRSLAKDLSLLVIDGAYGVGNGRVMPAGPLREPLARGLGRAHAAIILGADESATERLLAGRLPVLHAGLAPRGADDLSGRDVVAFAGIGRPAKFYATLAALGARLVATHDFPDHHPYGAAALRPIIAAARRAGAQTVTTEKDWVRLPAALRGEVRAVAVTVAWGEPEALDGLLAGVLLSRRPDG